MLSKGQERMMVLACLLCQEGHGCTLIKQSELAICVLLVSRVAIDSSIQKCSVEVPDKRPNIPVTA